MKDDETNPLTNFGSRKPFNELPEDEQVQEMGKAAPRYQSPQSIAQLVPNKTDADYAAELRQRVIEAYQPLFALLEEADKRGFNINSTVGKDFMGKFTFAQLQVMKVY